MEITLRRAAKLRTKIQQTVQSLSHELSNSSIHVNAFDANIENKLEDARNEFLRNLALYNSLSDVLINHRARIGAKNNDTYVSDRITKINGLKARNELYRLLSSSDVRMDDSEVSARIQTHTKQLEAGNAYLQDLYLPFLSMKNVEDIKTMHVALTREIENLQDEVEAINAKTTILLTDTEVAILETASLL